MDKDGVMSERDEHIYLAGFFDGEGCVGIYHFGHKPMIALTVSGTHEDSILRFKRAFGGNVTNVKAKPHLNHKPVYQWRLSGRKALVVLDTLLPWLTVKRPVAEAVLAGWPALTERLRDDKGIYIPQPEIRAQQLKVREAVMLLNRRGIA